MFFKSFAVPGDDKLIHCTLYSGSIFECIKYDIITNSYIVLDNFTFVMTMFEYNCDIKYFEESDQIVISLNGIEFINEEFITTLIVYICDLEVNCTYTIFKTIENITDLYDIYPKVNVVIPKDKLTYHILAYNQNSEKYLYDLGIKFDLKCKNYYNYQKTSCLEEIPEGYFCNNTKDKTIDKCHENCKSCNETSTEDNNNCLTCKDGDLIFYNLGNCVENCPNGYFIDDIHNLTCKCTNNIKCFLCSENGECKSCNNEKGYFLKSDDDEINGIVNCYKDPEGYYLFNNKYYPCYLSCKNCTEQGNEVDNKCTECKDGYEIKSDFENDNNCYKICEFYYYFDENKTYHCTTTNNCPTEFNQLIPEQNKCVKKYIHLIYMMKVTLNIN